MNSEKNTVPLERALSKLGVLSRNNTRRLIDKKRVKVNGRVITSHFFPVELESDIILIDDQPVRPPEHVYILTHKIKGQVHLFVNEKTRETVFKELPPEIHHVVPAGRLDPAAEGLFLYTNDTKWSSRVLELESTGTEIYIVRGEGELTEDDLQ
ncbi:rRNA pseudouridine synthase, partial [Candidatus Nomurabacteria bacterium]|nr:rRNA pseudouridine synthase [Candidatus Nomurabacteria bacterium]